MDYTKVARRLFENQHKNYHLTFSLSETNQEIAKTVAAAGFNVAVVFNIDKKNPLPKRFWDKKVICGDDSDLRFLDKKGTIVGLIVYQFEIKPTFCFLETLTSFSTDFFLAESGLSFPK